MKTTLSSQRCKPCSGKTPPLRAAEIKHLLTHLAGWNVTSNYKMIYLDLQMKDFVAAVQLIQKITKIAQKEDHHPDLHLTGYRHLRIELSTHAIGGLSHNDFILAAKIDDLPKSLKVEILK